jgi:large subunit ribosomal protein L28
MICEVCGKRRMVGNKISHSNIKTKVKQNANVQKVRAVVNGKVCRVHVCTRCLRSGKVTKVA